MRLFSHPSVPPIQHPSLYIKCVEAGCWIICCESRRRRRRREAPRPAAAAAITKPECEVTWDIRHQDIFRNWFASHAANGQAMSHRRRPYRLSNNEQIDTYTPCIQQFICGFTISKQTGIPLPNTVHTDTDRCISYNNT